MLKYNKMKVINNALQDSCMFCIGIVFGITIDTILDKIYIYTDPSMTSKKIRFILGLFQVLLNGIIIRSVEVYGINRGLMTLGLFGSQVLLIQTIYTSKFKLKK